MNKVFSISMHLLKRVCRWTAYAPGVLSDLEN